MTPAARFGAAIDVLDKIVQGASAEQTLTTWARQNRYAGSKDRAAVRDHVYDVLRQKRSVAARGGGQSGRALILGLLRAQGIDPKRVFGAGGYAPDALTAEETSTGREMSPAEAVDMPDWLWPTWCESLGDVAEDVARMQQTRAGMFLRVNLRTTDVNGAQASLAADGITTEPLDDIHTALHVTENERKTFLSDPYKKGLVEVQDAASQAAMIDLVPHVLTDVLDYCAGGGGKALALADLTGAKVYAHDISPARTADLPMRAKRAGVEIDLVETSNLRSIGPFQTVLCDAPCSGSGTWRRTPDAKWRLTDDDLDTLVHTQSGIIRDGAKLVALNGTLAYATCSVLDRENDAVVGQFLDENSGFQIVSRRKWLPSILNDGFYLAIMRRAD